MHTRKEVAKSKDCGVARETKKIIANKGVDDKKVRSIVLKTDKEDKNKKRKKQAGRREERKRDMKRRAKEKKKRPQQNTERSAVKVSEEALQNVSPARERNQLQEQMG